MMAVIPNTFFEPTLCAEVPLSETGGLWLEPWGEEGNSCRIEVGVCCRMRIFLEHVLSIYSYSKGTRDWTRVRLGRVPGNALSVIL